MTKLRLLIIVLLGYLFCIDCLSQNTYDGDMLYVYTKKNKEAALYQLDELNKITFSSKGIRIWNTNWPTEYPYAKIRVITFRDRRFAKPTGIETTFADENNVSISYNNSSKIVIVKSGTLLDGVAVYDLQGQLIFVDNNKRNNYQISLKNAHQGLYIVKAVSKCTENIKKILKQ